MKRCFHHSAAPGTNTVSAGSSPSANVCTKKRRTRACAPVSVRARSCPRDTSTFSIGVSRDRGCEPTSASFCTTTNTSSTARWTGTLPRSAVERFNATMSASRASTSVMVSANCFFSSAIARNMTKRNSAWPSAERCSRSASTAMTARLLSPTVRVAHCPWPLFCAMANPRKPRSRALASPSMVGSAYGSTWRPLSSSAIRCLRSSSAKTTNSAPAATATSHTDRHAPATCVAMASTNVLMSAGVVGSWPPSRHAPSNAPQNP